MAWTVLTSVLLALPTWRGVPAVAVVFAWVRLADTMSQKLMELLVHSVRGRPLFAGVQRSLLLSALNLYEIIACYAIIYLANGGVYRNLAEGGVEPLTTATAGLYFSMVTGLTVGYGDFLPTTDGARRLAMSEMATVAVFIVAWFPTIAALLFPSSKDASPRTSQ